MSVNDWIDKRMLVDFFDSGESKDYNRGRNDGRLQELNLIKSSLSNVEYNRKVEIPQFVVEWLNNPDVGYSLSEKIKYLILSHDGDEYYFCDMMVNDSIMSLDLADKMYRYSQKESVENLLQLINGYEVVEEPKYYVAFPALEWNENKAELETKNMYLLHDETSDETNFSLSPRRVRDFVPELTEETIKALDERFWPFAVAVEKEVSD